MALVFLFLIQISCRKPNCKISERECRLQLNQPRRGIGSEKRAEDARRRANGGEDLPEIRARRIIDRQTKVRMIEHVVDLHAQSQPRALPERKSRGLHQRHVGIEEARPAKNVAHASSESALAAHIELARCGAGGKTL